MAGLLLYTGLVIGISYAIPGNEKLYGAVAGILGNFNGALFMYLRMKPPSGPPGAPTA